jgi:quercetin dioxygenase-like cupin family protein
VLTRRGFAVCGVCAAAGLRATAVDAQAAPPALPGIKRAMLRQTDFPGGYVTALVTVELEPGAIVPWHIHPGVETAYVVEGDSELSVKGQAVQALAAGGSAQIPPYTPHWVRNGQHRSKLALTYVVEKGKPMMTLVNE